MDFNELSDEDILADEVQEMKGVDIKKEEIINRAAEKLEKSGKYDNDLTDICARIQKLWPKISKSHITETLDGKYVRAYEKKEPNTPEGLFEEILFVMEDLHNDLAKISADIVKKCREDPDVRKKVEQSLVDSIHKMHTNLDEFINDFRNKLSNVGQLKDFLEFLKSEQTDIDYIKTLTDYREKLDIWFKVRLRMMFTEQHLAELGKDIHYSSKWMSAIKKDENIALIDKQTEYTSIEGIINKLRMCPACGHDMAEWFIKAVIADEKGRPVPKPKVPKKIMCATCKGPVVVSN